MMGSFLRLAVEAGAVELSESAEGSLGFNLDILGTNLINLAIILALLTYFGRGFLGKILAQRREDIEAAIQSAEARQQQAAKQLEEQQQKLAQAQAEAERIRASGQESAKAAKEAILAQATEDVERLRESTARDTASDQERAIAELRQRVVALALEQAESEISSTFKAESDQRKLVDRSIALLGGQS